MRTRLEEMLDEVQNYKRSQKLMKTNVEDRLNKVLDRYLEDIDTAFVRVRGKKLDIVVKELSRK